MRCALAVAVAVLFPALCAGQELVPLALRDVSLSAPALQISRHAERGQPFTVAGPRGIVVGEQSGTFEQWVLPVKVLSHMTLEATLAGYTVPIDLNAAARAIEVSPERTVITYSHIGFTVRQIMFAPEEAPPGTGAVVLFQVDSTRTLDLTLRFTPELRPMWPERGKGTPSAEWVTRGGSGFYVLHSDYPDFAAAIALPTATSGILAPYQEKPQIHPLEFHLHFDPTTERGQVFPLLVATGENATDASTATLESRLAALDRQLPALFAAHVARVAERSGRLTAIETPDQRLDEDFRWAVVSVEQLQARTAAGETALVAGYFDSGDSARPGFGWYFGRDALYTLPAVNGFGDFALARSELEFLLARQRADGKIMHEYSQTAAASDWGQFPYFYAAADATPLLLTGVLEYVRASGDVAFLRTHRAAVERAWAFETSHGAADSGIYTNAQGTGWVESWPGGMPRQEIYLALLDEQASDAMAALETMLGDAGLSRAATERARRVHAAVERIYFSSASGQYAFSFNGEAGTDRTATVYPALAWWNGAGGLEHAESSLRRWNSHVFATDWGLRDVAEDDPVYDPMSYHQGSVWPLFTGWAAVAEYRGGHPVAGFADLLSNANQTVTQDLGAVTELLSGAFFAPFGRSTSHQLWSSAMVVTPVLRGMFGLEVDALAGTIRTEPRLPAAWGEAAIRRLHVGPATADVEYARAGGMLRVTLTHVAGGLVRLGQVPGMRVATDGLSGMVALPAVEVGYRAELPLTGARTTQPKVLGETRTERGLTLEVEGQGGTNFRMQVRRNGAVPRLTVEGGSLRRVAGGEELEVVFPAGEGYQLRVVKLGW